MKQGINILFMNYKQQKKMIQCYFRRPCHILTETPLFRFLGLYTSKFYLRTLKRETGAFLCQIKAYPRIPSDANTREQSRAALPELFLSFFDKLIFSKKL